MAVLPFLVEQYGPDARPHYLVSKVDAEEIPDRFFQPGVELESWNGVPFARAVEIHADPETGGRPDSRRARALESLTFRALEYGPPPDELWVIVGYRTQRGRPPRSSCPGGSSRPKRPGPRWTSAPGPPASMAADLSGEAVRRAKKLMFATDLWAADRERRPRRLGPPDGGWLATSLQDVLAARELSRPGRLSADLVLRRGRRRSVRAAS